MTPAQLRDQIEQATPQEKRQHKQWINWWLGGKLAKRMASAERQLEVGLTEQDIRNNEEFSREWQAEREEMSR